MRKTPLTTGSVGVRVNKSRRAWVAILPTLVTLLLPAFEQPSQRAAVEEGSEPCASFPSFSSAELGRMRPQRLQKGRVGGGEEGGKRDLKSQHCCRKSCLFKLFSNGLIFLYIVPLGQTNQHWKLARRPAQRLSQNSRSLAGRSWRWRLPQPLRAWLMGKDIKQRPAGCEDTFLVGECNTNLKVLCWESRFPKNVYFLPTENSSWSSTIP